MSVYCYHNYMYVGLTIGGRRSGGVLTCSSMTDKIRKRFLKVSKRHGISHAVLPLNLDSGLDPDCYLDMY